MLENPHRCLRRTGRPGPARSPRASCLAHASYSSSCVLPPSNCGNGTGSRKPASSASTSVPLLRGTTDVGRVSPRAREGDHLVERWLVAGDHRPRGRRAPALVAAALVRPLDECRGTLTRHVRVAQDDEDLVVLPRSLERTIRRVLLRCDAHEGDDREHRRDVGHGERRESHREGDHHARQHCRQQAPDDPDDGHRDHRERAGDEHGRRPDARLSAIGEMVDGVLGQEVDEPRHEHRRGHQRHAPRGRDVVEQHQPDEQRSDQPDAGPEKA